MKSLSIFSRLLVAAALCLALATPALAAEAAPAAKPAPAAAKPAAPAKKPAVPAKASAAPKKAPAAPKAAPAGKSAANSPEALQKGLDDFAKTTIATLNRCVVPSSGKKEVLKNGDGSFTARYIEIDPGSVKTWYKQPEKPGPVAYVGYMSYNEVEYHCTAPSKAAAEKGPFVPKSNKMLTELIKHYNGKWTY